MKALLIGFSRIARRRVLPALLALGRVRSVAVASKSARRETVDAAYALFNDYETAVRESGADLAYISVANSDHALWARRCLRAGMHVVVDKPAVLTTDDAQALVAESRSAGRLIAEATVFGYHPQFTALQRAFADAGVAPKRAVALFSFPPFEPGDFRNVRALGGGAFYDLGPYVAATSRLLFGQVPQSIACTVTSRNADGLDTGFSALLSYAGGGALTGHFGFDTEYQNRLLVFGAGLAVDVNRAFTLPPDAAGRLALRAKNAESVADVAPADAFKEFLHSVFAAIDAADFDPLRAALAADAQLLSNLRHAAGEK